MIFRIIGVHRHCFKLILLSRPLANHPDTGRSGAVRRISPGRRMRPVLETHAWRKRMPAVTYEPDPLKLRDRCHRAGGDSEAVALIPKVFCQGVSLKALTRLRTAEEVASEVFGKGPGPVYLAFLEVLPEGNGDLRYGCRLCSGWSEGHSWKNQRDVLRHLRRQHFGVGDRCDMW